MKLKLTVFGFLTLLACAKGSEIATQDVVILNASPAEADRPDASSSVVTEPSPTRLPAAPDAAVPSVVEQIDTPSASAAENLPATASNAADAAPPSDAGPVPPVEVEAEADAAPPTDAGVDAAL